MPINNFEDFVTTQILIGVACGTLFNSLVPTFIASIIYSFVIPVAEDEDYDVKLYDFNVKSTRCARFMNTPIALFTSYVVLNIFGN